MRDDRVLTHDAGLEPRNYDLVRQAYLLTGDREQATRLAERALGPVRLQRGPTDSAEADELARTELVRSFVADPGRMPPAEHLDLPGWQALGRLSPRRRAAIVLRFDEGLDEEHAAARLGTSAQSVRADVDAALLTLRTTMRGAADPWALVTAALSTVGDRWYVAAGLPPAPRRPPRPAGTVAVPDRPVPGVGPAGSIGQSGAFGSFGRMRVDGPPVAGLPPAPGPRQDAELLARGPADDGPLWRRFVSWPVAAAAALTAVVVLGAVTVVPALRAADSTSTVSLAPAAAGGAPERGVPTPVPSRKVAPGLLDWPARGARGEDPGVLAAAATAWRTAVRGADTPTTDISVLYAGEVDGTQIVMMQALDGTGRPVLAQLGATATGPLRLAKAGPLPSGTAVLSLLPANGPAGPNRVLVSPEAQTADGLLTADPTSGNPLRRMPVDSEGVSGVLPSPPGAPTCSRVVVLGLRTLQGRTSSGPRVLQSGIVRANLLTLMSEPVEVGSARLAPADSAVPAMTWFGDGMALGKKIDGRGTLVVAALGPRLPDRQLSGADPRKVSSAAYELRRGGRTWIGSVVRIDGKTICASATPVSAVRADGNAAFVLRCPVPGGTTGLLHVIGGAEVSRIDVALKPTPAPPGQRDYANQFGPPGGLRSTSSFAALQVVASGFPCGTGSVRVATGGQVPATATTLPLYTP